MSPLAMAIIVRFHVICHWSGVQPVSRPAIQPIEALCYYSNPHRIFALFTQAAREQQPEEGFLESMFRKIYYKILRLVALF